MTPFWSGAVGAAVGILLWVALHPAPKLTTAEVAAAVQKYCIR